MYRISKAMIFILIFILIIMGCTQKKNTVGVPDVDNEPIEMIISDTTCFGNFYSFEDSCRNYIGNSKLVVGTYENNEAKSLIKFTSLPDTVYQFDSENITLTLWLENSLNFESLEFGKLKQEWIESYVTWKAATDSTDWEDEFFESLDFTFDVEQTDSLNIEIPIEKFYSEVSRSYFVIDSLIYDFGLIIYSGSSDDENRFIEIKSRESGTGSLLSFDYTPAEGDTSRTFSNTATYDTFMYLKKDGTNEDFLTFENELIISNIQPIKMYLNFNISDSVFINADSSGIEIPYDYTMMTINKAELILSVKDSTEFTYPLETSFTLFPYLVTNEEPQVPFSYDEDYEYIYGTINSSGSSSDSVFVIDITKIVQGITSGENENNGILIKSTKENKDFSFIDFGTKFDEGKEPKLRIIYTPPIFED
ncbi:MAG: hypothetical protein HQ534_06030 [Armatimonadetes bacterium]|nr:hypothetical protein [Armatimonadota bacterium]